MICPNCNSHFECRGANREDYHCRNSECPARKEVQYRPHIAVRENNWFAIKYNLPFKFNNEWYAIEGDGEAWNTASNGDKIEIQGIGRIYLFSLKYDFETYQYQTNNYFTSFTYSSLFKSCIKTKIKTFPYRALPVNENDFPREFNKLVDKIMNKYLVLI